MKARISAMKLYDVPAVRGRGRASAHEPDAELELLTSHLSVYRYYALKSSPSYSNFNVGGGVTIDFQVPVVDQSLAWNQHFGQLVNFTLEGFVEQNAGMAAVRNARVAGLERTVRQLSDRLAATEAALRSLRGKHEVAVDVPLDWDMIRQVASAISNQLGCSGEWEVDPAAGEVRFTPTTAQAMSAVDFMHEAAARFEPAILARVAFVVGVPSTEPAAPDGMS